MSTPDDRVYLSHIRDAIETIEGFLQGTTYERFAANRMMVDAASTQILC
jgi:uncharacterized protein with HEPN domain